MFELIVFGCAIFGGLVVVFVVHHAEGRIRGCAICGVEGIHAMTGPREYPRDVLRCGGCGHEWERA